MPKVTITVEPAGDPAGWVKVSAITEGMPTLKRRLPSAKEAAAWAAAQVNFAAARGEL